MTPKEIQLLRWQRHKDMTTESKDELRAELKAALQGTEDLKNQVKDQSTIIRVLTNRVRDLEKST